MCGNTYPHIQKFHNTGVMEGEDTLQYDNMRGVNGRGMVETLVLSKGINRNLGTFARRSRLLG